MPDRLVIGMEFSTQSAKAVVLGADSANVLTSIQLNYDETFPQYGTKGGVLPSEDATVRHTSPAMLSEAMDELFRRLGAADVEMARVRALKLDAQQHCTVYADDSLADRLSALDEGAAGAGDAGPAAGNAGLGTGNLAAAVAPAFTRNSVPIWEDRSTAREVQLLEAALAGQGGVQHLTANPTELRFPAAQIVRWALADPDAYAQTAHIMLLSAFLTPLLTGCIAPVDTGDGWGTNLNHADIDDPGWHPDTVSAVEELIGRPGSLTARLGEMVPYDTPVGRVSGYFSRRYGLPADAMVLAGTGDNPATLLGCGGKLVISLGSSYTVNGVVSELDALSGAEYNVFGYTPGTAMALSVITNGTKVHDKFRREYAHGETWDEYERRAGGRTVDPEEPLLLPYLQAESVPRAPAGFVRDGLSAGDREANIRALHISQALSLRLHASHVASPEAIAVVGGGSQNDALRAYTTDAFGRPTYRIRNGDFAAPLGCAIAAARHLLRCSYEAATARFVAVEAGSELSPLGRNDAAYDRLLTRYRQLEAANRVTTTA